MRRPPWRWRPSPGSRSQPCCGGRANTPSIYIPRSRHSRPGTNTIVVSAITRPREQRAGSDDQVVRAEESLTVDPGAFDAAGGRRRELAKRLDCVLVAMLSDN